MTTMRDRIAAAIFYVKFPFLPLASADPQVRKMYYAMADAVLAELESPSDEMVKGMVAEMLNGVSDQLVKFCREFIDKQDIHCAETVYQADRVIQNAYEFIEGVCEIVGYKPREDQEYEL